MLGLGMSRLCCSQKPRQDHPESAVVNCRGWLPSSETLVEAILLGRLAIGSVGWTSAGVGRLREPLQAPVPASLVFWAVPLGIM